jgi:hypothetical protein
MDSKIYYSKMGGKEESILQQMVLRSFPWPVFGYMDKKS